ncbi:hypothetical protein FKM82_011638 [Ascaphus truei]
MEISETILRDISYCTFFFNLFPLLETYRENIQIHDVRMHITYRVLYFLNHTILPFSSRLAHCGRAVYLGSNLCGTAVSIF